ncbi:OsmC family protein [Nocardioides sp. GY 10113]|uniref:OsmC family protein n=1 Tax=Nocardioides sp. GY 10113 TaxID=2569761 RepID=UPI0010A8BBDB|nr:OsmC family protein [Nocardioides sp. GY 10113]TIC87611.1 OsmC family protein [Nocardioides sp. GY 10113]
MTTTQQHPRINGVDTAALFGTIDVVRTQPELAAFRFRSRSTWVSGTHSVGTFLGFTGAGQDHLHATPVEVPADHPAVLTGTDHGPTPAELLLNALGACLTAGLGNIAAARGVELRGVRCTVEGDLDLRGILGLDDSVRNGFRDVRVTFEVDSDADAATVAALVAQSRARSAVYDVLTAGTRVEVGVAAS